MQACFHHHLGWAMCDSIGRAINEAIERRRLLGGTGASLLAAVLGTPASAAEIAQQEARIAQAKSAAAAFDTRLLLLGTAGGPTYWPNTNRRSTSSALVVGDAVYLVDCGDGVGKRLQEALEPPDSRQTMKALRAVFLTHLHSDHVVDYPNILLYGWFSGIELATSPLRVFGPGRRGEMEPMSSHGPATSAESRTCVATRGDSKSREEALSLNSPTQRRSSAGTTRPNTRKSCRTGSTTRPDAPSLSRA